LWAAKKLSLRICLRGDSRLDESEPWKQVDPPDPRHRSKTARPAEVKEYRIHPHHYRTKLEELITREAGAPPWHIPAEPPPYYLDSLTSEEKILATRRKKGGGTEQVFIWQPRVTTATSEKVNVRTDTHWSDGEKMAIAMADILGINEPIPPHESTADPRAAAASAAADDTDTHETATDEFFAGTW
jgi:hypothetical protein